MLMHVLIPPQHSKFSYDISEYACMYIASFVLLQVKQITLLNKYDEEIYGEKKTAFVLGKLFNT